MEKKKWWIKYKIHVLAWTGYFIYEIMLLYLMGGLFSHPLVDPLHFLLNVCFFYINAFITLPLFLKTSTRIRYFLVPVLIIQMAIYVLVHFSLDKILIALDVIVLKKVYVINWAVITRNLYRGVYYFGFSTGFYFLSTYLRERKRAEELEQDKLKAIIQQQQMQQDLLNAQNAFLKAQINPHFLFNTLDFVYHNVNRHSPIAGEAIARLAEMMRFAIAAGEREQSMPLSAEIEQVENLIFLYQIRKNNELAIAFNYPPAALNIKTIPLVLLTLVENIFKHGHLSKDKNHLASIELELTDDFLQITTSNTICLKNPVYMHMDQICSKLHFFTRMVATC
ncbi:MAG: histidine kinase [Flavobacterium sp.]|nr:MAG: histidine kinase [Flavobacterium sp.]